MEFFDAQTDDARLCVEVLRTAAVHGATLANYVEAVGFVHEDGQLAGVRARDHASGRELVIRARRVVNAAGPWADAVRRLAGAAGRPLLAPTKGAHLVVAGRGLKSAFLLLHPADARVFFVIPWLGKTLLGTTDTADEDSPDTLGVTDEDTSYLLEGHNHYFTPALGPADVLGRFAGLRPLARLRTGTAGEAPSDRSRDFEVVAGPPGMVTVVGGKYTTFRHMAEVITDGVVGALGLRLPCRTRRLRLDGAPDEPWDAFAPREAARLCADYQLGRAAAEHLLRRYGRRAEEVAVYVGQDPSLGKPVVEGEPELLAEFLFHREREMARTPADFLLRRTRLGLFHPELLDDPPALTRAG
jgi:glycerol-3-phosphate dehydrogenase